MFTFFIHHSLVLLSSGWSGICGSADCWFRSKSGRIFQAQQESLFVGILLSGSDPNSSSLSLSISWSGQNGDSDWLLPDETLPLHRRRGHRLDQDLQAWFCDRPAAELPGRVSLPCSLTVRFKLP